MEELGEDLLQNIFARIPLIHLVPASSVCSAWDQAAVSSVRRWNRLKPWIIIRKQNKRRPERINVHAYDPRSRMWVRINQSAQTGIDSVLRQSHSNFLFFMSSFTLSFSLDPFHLSWYSAHGMKLLRTDPVVALVGRRVVIAGGVCDLEDDPLAVEVYNMDSTSWETFPPLPDHFKNTASSTWLSATAGDHELLLLEKYSARLFSLDMESKVWRGPYQLHHDQRVLYSFIAFSLDYYLLLIEVCGEADSVETVKLWTVKPGSFVCEEMVEMPQELVAALVGDSLNLSAISICCTKNLLYIYNSSMVGDFIICRITMDDRKCEWELIPNPVDCGDCSERVVLSCADVGINDIRRAMRSRTCQFLEFTHV